MKKQEQILLPSAHLLVLFKPFFEDEPRMLKVIKRLVEMNYYKGIELGVFFDEANRRAVRKIVEEDDLFLTIYATPYLKGKGMSLCDLNRQKRRLAVNYLIDLLKLAAQMGCRNFGIPSGDDPGEALREDAKAVLKEAIIEVAQVAAGYGMNLTLEPLDRYVHKKQLIGPMEETMAWFKDVHEKAPNTYIHWDSAHEALGGIDLIESLNYAKGYISSFHLCNAILDKTHPCFGDLHMDVGQGPDFETEGFLTPEVGGEILKELASFPKAKGIEDTYVSVEVLSHPGDDMWAKERVQREFLDKCFDIAKGEYHGES